MFGHVPPPVYVIDAEPAALSTTLSILDNLPTLIFIQHLVKLATKSKHQILEF